MTHLNTMMEEFLVSNLGNFSVMVKGDPTGEVRQTYDFVEVGDVGDNPPRPAEDTSDTSAMSAVPDQALTKAKKATSAMSAILDQ